MFLVMCVTLYTSRIVLEQLGVSDYGVYSLVGGIVALFGFLNSSMSSATQRYLAYDLGKQDEKRLQKTFSATLTVHIGIAILIFLAAETVGLWYVNFKVILPPDRLFAANIAYQFSIFAAMISIIQVPYDSLITAYEKMSVYAYIGIIEVCLRLGLVYLLGFFGGDKLIVYAGLTFLVSILIIVAYIIYYRKNYNACKYSFEYDKAFFKELISYSGWNLFGGLASVSTGQGINIVLNLFFGTVVNASYGLTLQVQSAVNQFVTNFQKAVNPQIIKSYSNGDLDRMQTLIIRSSKFSFLMIFFVAAPFLLNTDFILNLWLKNPPKHTSYFIQLILISILFDSISYPFRTGVQATGKIKEYQFVVGSIQIISLPITYIWLCEGGKSESVFYIIIMVSIVALICRFYYVKKQLNLDLKIFFNKVIVQVMIMSISLYFFWLILNYIQLKSNWLQLTISLIITVILLLTGLNKKDFHQIKDMIM